MSAKFDSGFFVREPAWHGMGTVLDTYPENWAEARKLADMEWEPISAPMFGFVGVTKAGTVTYDPADAVTGDYQRIEEKQLIRRGPRPGKEKQGADPDAGRLLGTPTDEYNLITHSDIGEIVEAVLNAKEPGKHAKPQYETTVVLDGGKKIAACIRLDGAVRIGGFDSPTLPYLTLTAAHDGTGACRGQQTSIRVVCANTFAAAELEADRNGTVWTFSHRGDWRERLEEAAATLAGVRKNFAEYVEFANHLTKIKVGPPQELMFLEQFLPMALEEGAQSDRVKQNILDARATVKAIMDSPTCAPLGPTAYRMFQAGTEYLDWYRGYRNKSTLFGRQLLKAEPRKAALVATINSVVLAA